MTDIVERLKRVRYTRERGDGPNGTYFEEPCDADDADAVVSLINPDGPEAAAEIERLRKELAVAMAVVRGAQAAHDAERQRRARRLAEAVEVIRAAPVRPDCDWKCGEGTSHGPCNCGARKWQERRDAFLAKLEKKP